MTKQTKRKVFAATASAALIASAVVPAATLAAESSASFPDVTDTYKWAKDAIDYLVEKGAIEGHPDGTFAPADSIKRGEAAKILAITLGLKVDDNAKTDFEDAKNHWSSKFIAAITSQKPGVIEGYQGKFRPEDNITRQEMAKMVVNAYGLKLDEKADVSFDDNKGWGANDINVLASLGVVQGVAKGKFDPEASVTRAQTPVFVHRAEVPSVRVEVPQKQVADLAVASVSAINAKQLVIEFNKAVDKGTVIEAGLLGAPDTLVDDVFELSRLPAGSDAEKQVTINDAIAKLSGDGKTLTLTADNTEYFEGTYALAITSSVRATTGETLSAYTTTFTASEDKTAPTVKDITFNPATNLVKIIMSEPVEIEPTATVNNGAPKTLTGNSINTEFTFENTAEAGSTIQVSVNGAVDYKGNDQTTAYSKSVKINYEESMIKIESLTQKSSNEAKLVFDKSIAKPGTAATIATLIETELSVLRGGNAQGFTASFDADDDTYRTVIIKFDGTGPNYDVYASGQDTASLVFILGEDALTDIFGNTNAEISKTLTISKDKAAPKITSTRLSSDKKALEVVFDENISDEDIDNLVSVRKDGVVVSTAAGTAGFRVTAATINKKVLVIPYQSAANAATNVPAGDYTVRFAKDAIKDSHNNKNDALVSQVVKVGSTNADSDVTVLTIADGVGDNEYVVTFDGKVGNSALLASSYSLNGAALPSGTDIVFTDSDKDTVNIKLPNESVNYSSLTAVLRVVNVLDTDGNRVTPDSDTVTVVDNVKPVLSAATLTGNTLTLTYSEDMDSSLTGLKALTGIDEIIGDLEIKGNSVALADLDGTADDLVLTVDGKNVTITFTNLDSADNNWAIVKAASKITIKTVNGDEVFVDANGTVQKKDVTVTVVKK